MAVVESALSCLRLLTPAAAGGMAMPASLSLATGAEE